MPENQRNSSRSKSSRSDQNASKKEEENDVPLDEIAENVSAYFKKFDHFKKYEKDITKKYQKYYDTTEALPDCWSVDFINRAWRKTKLMYTFSGRRKCWSLAILFQVMKRSRGNDESESKAQSDVKESPQSGGDPSANEPAYIRIPFSEMINGKGCYRSDTDPMDIVESPQDKEYKLIDKVPSPTQILQNDFYITLYDNQTRNAAWVYEILNKSTLPKKSTKTNNKPFKKDASVHHLFQPSTDTYKGTGYARGHLAAAANHNWCQKAHDDTYLISNIVPQQGNFNSGMWLRLEEYCREIAKTEEVCNVHVYTGPLYLSSDGESKDKNDQNKIEKLMDDNNDPNKRKKLMDDNNDQNQNKKHMKFECLGGKAVPTHLFKVIIVENNDGKVLAPQCYKMPNELPNKGESKTNEQSPMKKIKEQSTIERSRSRLEQYKEKIKDIQRDSGLIFDESEVKEEKSEDNQRNSRLKEEITDETYEVKWTAEEGGTLIKDWKVKVRVSGSYTDHSDRAVLH